MAIWPRNQSVYIAKLKAVVYIAENYWKYMLEKKSEDGTPEPMVRFSAPYYGDLPKEILPILEPHHFLVLDAVLLKHFLRREEIWSIDVDDLVSDLDWNFNPMDLAQVKMNRKEPHVNRYEKRKK